MSRNALSAPPLDITQVLSASAQRELESLANQHGLPVQYYRQPYTECLVKVSVSDYRMQLNNMAAARGLSPVEYEGEYRTGPEHNPRWTSTAESSVVKATAAAKAPLVKGQLSKL
ncbi:hypothetical protein C0992_008463 [Termitomyces sp. T32_za158]|nr:hypothetical protein C0992_008463 [Termitomyces sp. T32_za158]